MTRSRKKMPFAGACAHSDKSSKKLAHRQERQAARDALSRDNDPPGSKAFGNPGNSNKDGKIWLGWNSVWVRK